MKGASLIHVWVRKLVEGKKDSAWYRNKERRLRRKMRDVFRSLHQKEMKMTYNVRDREQTTMTIEEVAEKVESYQGKLEELFKGENSMIAGVATLEFALRLERLTKGCSTKEAAASLISTLEKVG